MAKIFISYRREESAYPAQQIYGVLTNHFGSESVVFDVNTIPLGLDFREYLNKEVSKCDILLAVIGDQWIEILKQRLDEPNDFVRIEIQAALERDIPVVPILVGKASVPIEKNLPPELAVLAYRNAAEVRAGPDLQAHLKRLIGGLDHLLSERKAGKELKQKTGQKSEAVLKTIKNSIGMEFALIPTGSFMMGSYISPEETVRKYGGELEFYKWEHPQHEVRINKEFYLQSTQVSQTQWKKVMEDNPSEFKDCGDDCPIESVSWEDAHKFIKKLNKIEKTDKYRLPTEAEWEYACRAGTKTEFSFGDYASELSEYAWFEDNSENRTHSVGTKKPNFWGLYDIHGNVWEWVEDDWHDTYDGVPSDGSAWIIESRVPRRVLRGGGWYFGALYCRSAFRFNGTPDDRDAGVGFRLARSVALGS